MQQFQTKRLTIPAMEAILGKEFPVLDKGFIRVVDYLGGDGAVVQAARCSYGAGTKKVNEDRGLIRYLMRHSHTTPLEMCELKLHMKLPIFVARQLIRHRTASVNEYSARYSEVKDEFYLPERDRVQLQSLINKQGSGDVAEGDRVDAFIEKTLDTQLTAIENYREFNDVEQGQIAKELNRINMPVANYTEWYWKVDLHNLLRFVSLRSDKHAQLEIRVYSDVILNEILPRWVPIVYEAFKDYDHRQSGAQLSKFEMNTVRKLLSSLSEDVIRNTLAEQSSNISVREVDEFINKLKEQHVE
jgi:thymidylate synthase (FAD)